MSELLRALRVVNGNHFSNGNHVKDLGYGPFFLVGQLYVAHIPAFYCAHALICGNDLVEIQENI